MLSITTAYEDELPLGLPSSASDTVAAGGALVDAGVRDRKCLWICSADARDAPPHRTDELVTGCGDCSGTMMKFGTRTGRLFLKRHDRQQVDFEVVCANVVSDTPARSRSCRLIIVLDDDGIHRLTACD